MKKISLNTLILSLGLVLFSLNIHAQGAKEYHVSKSGNDKNDGSFDMPFLSINEAVKHAMPGDTITVHEGTYREWIKPLRGGESDDLRIVYRAAPREKVEIKGSEEVSDWKREGKGVWKLVLPSSFFGNYNPYQDSIFGDWFYDLGRLHHTGEVFLNGKSLYERASLDEVINPKAHPDAKDLEGSTYTWYCESDEEKTTIWANFHDFNPKREFTEISVRPTCFYPEKPGINYLTISGFDISQAATQWGAPTAGQVGMVATHWNKGWIIENNVIHDSKCSGITLGKEHGTGHNVWSADIGSVNNDGNIHYIEVVFRVLRNGWNKENIGSHIVRNNTIYNCEQTGMCGSMGASFCTIENNHIYDIWTKRQFRGAEIGGIKFHAPVDAIIRNNRIHNTGRGLWLDWMTQGTRVSGNIFYNNDLEDLFLEVNHGPYVVDNNIFLSKYALRTQSGGGAFIHNLFAGIVHNWPEPNRYTPYFLPHSTDMAGLITIYGGDDRYYNNIFVGGKEKPKNPNQNYGLAGYNEVKLPVWMEGNIYYANAEPSDEDKKAILAGDFEPEIQLVEEDGQGFLHLNLDQNYKDHKVDIVTTALLGEAWVPKAAFDNPDGTPLKVDRDYFRAKRSASNNQAGPFMNLPEGKSVIKVW